MEIFHLVFFAVIVAETANVHADPHDTVGFVELTAATVKLRHEHGLLEQFLIAVLGVDTCGTCTIISKPHDAVAVDKDAADGIAVGTADLFRAFAVGETVDTAIGCAGKDVEAVGLKTEDGLVFQNGLALNGEVAAVQAVYALVGSKPDVVLVTFGHAGDSTTARRCLLYLEPPSVKTHDVKAHAVDGDQDVACARDDDGIVSAEFLITVFVLERIDDLVDRAVHHKHSSVVHPHPYILRLVDGQVEDSVVQVLDAAAVARLVIVEIIAVET